MGFFGLPTEVVKQADTGGVSIDFLHRLECRACPLNHAVGLHHPKMVPTGSETPLIYMLGETPSQADDDQGKHFTGYTGKILRYRIPHEWLAHMRWNNCVRTRTPKGRAPSLVEMECCRPSVERDIERTKPKAIFGFGNVPLKWALDQSGIAKWNGRRIPIKVGAHKCWFFPMLHPSHIGDRRRFEPRGPHEYGSEEEFAFALDFKHAFEDVEDMPEPVIHDRDYAMQGIEWVTGEGRNDLHRVIDFMRCSYQENLVGLDYETNCLRPYSKGAKILTVALSTKVSTLVFPLHHSEAGWSTQDLGTLCTEFQRFLYQAKCRKVVHQLAFEMEWSAFFFGKGVLRAGKWGCSVSQAFILDERMKQGRPDCLSLEFLCLQYFGINVKKLSNLDRASDLDKMPLSQLLPYNGLDAKYHRLLYNVQIPLIKNAGLSEVYRLHMRRIPTMVLTQMKGLPVDQSVCDEFHNKLTGELNKIETKLIDLDIVKKFQQVMKRAYRPSAAQDIGLLIRKILRIPLDKVDETSLQEVKAPEARDCIRLTLQWRKNNKLLSTYVKPVRKGSPHLFNGRLHPMISTTRTRTWRTSAEDPNMQNWPKRKNKEVRRQIRPKAGYKVVSFDYANIQARNIAMESLDKGLIKAFWERYDVHTDWMENLRKLYPGWFKGDHNDKAVCAKYRDQSKNKFVFPSFFGAQPYSISKNLGVPENTIKKLQEMLWDRFPSIHAWQNRMKESYRELGYIQGLSGFRRRAPISANELINAPIQADEAAIVCDAMARLSELDYEKYQASMEIHDDLAFIWQACDVEKNSEVVIEQMVKVPFEWAHVVPIQIERMIGDDWFDMKDGGVFASDTWKKS